MRKYLDLVVVTIDALRTDALGCYGGRPQGLALDAFAERALVFSNHYAVATSSLMALYTLYSGVPPHLMPIQDLRTADFSVGSGATLGEILHRAGYRMLTTMEETCGLPDLDMPGAAVRNYRREPVFELFEDPPFPSHYPGRPDHALHGLASEAVPYALDWFARTPGPRFLHVWVTDLHITHRHPDFRRAAGLPAPPEVATDPNPIVRRYYDLVALVDQSIGHLLREIERLSDNALIVVTSDHGEALGERPARVRDAEWFATDGRQYDHGYPEQIEEALIHVPLLVRPPDGATGRVTDLVSATDFFPTLVGWAAPDLLPRPPDLEVWHPWCGPSGLLPSGGRETALAQTRWLFEPDRTSALITRDGWKLIRYPQRAPELFHLDSDPAERRNLWGESERGAELLERLEGIEAGAREEMGKREWWKRASVSG